MIIIRLAAISLLVTATSTFSTEQSRRPLPSTSGMQILKDTSQFMINEFEDACKSNITIIKSFNPDPVKPEGYKDPIYYTQRDKIGLIGNLNNLIKNSKDAVNKKLSDLEAAEQAKKMPLSNQDILKSFREIYGILNEGRKNCALSLSQMEKQAEKIKALNDCQLKIKKEPSITQKAKASVSRTVRKLLPGSRDQKGNQQADPANMEDREPPTNSEKAKKILGTKETREEIKQRRIREALKESGIG